MLGEGIEGNKMGTIGRNQNLFVDEKLSANQIIQWFIDKCAREKPQAKIFPNTYIGNWECDIVELTKSGYLYEYEVKISRADFKSDAKKETKFYSKANHKKYEVLQSGQRVNYFYYVVPSHLISVDEVPEFAGLIYVDTTYVNPYFKVIKQAPKLSKEKITPDKMLKLLDSIYYRFHQYRRAIIR